MISTTANRPADCEYVVVGSGAGGGTLAARLAEAGRSVVVLEAGGDPRKLSGGDPLQPELNRLPQDYDVPAFHGFASENEALKWDFFVRHYAYDGQQRLDPKYFGEFQGKPVDGVLYPRAGTLGGCTAHNAMILVAPDNPNWDYIAELTGDHSWSAERMWKYFERMENCHYRPLHRWLAKIGFNPTGHGWKGWLHTEKAEPMAALRNRKLRDVILESALLSFFDSSAEARRLRWFFESLLDPNDWRLVKQNAFGTRCAPLTTRNHARFGTRERLLETSRKHPNLRLVLNALATRVLFDDNNRAVGVEYLHGERLYRAYSRPNPGRGERRRIYASREVILAGGAFNSPQLLMLSGIGPRAVLEDVGIPVRVDLPGVGSNLQDRYEVGVVNRMNFPAWQVYKNATFSAADPQYRQWQTCRAGVYATNGSVLTVMRRSPAAEGPPDLFCMALLAKFEGYYPGYSQAVINDQNYLTWVVLKGHTQNRAGEVTLRSADPRDMPYVNFHYFEQGADQDLEAVIDGIRFVRKLTGALELQNFIAEEVLPGKATTSDQDLQAFVRNNAWGHHASCTCAIGPRKSEGVLGSDFRVHGTEGLRVVDASVFPRIPGLFIVSAIYMIAEKAADVIINTGATGDR
jgi:choline dehydrogenase-like flavoprotein